MTLPSSRTLAERFFRNSAFKRRLPRKHGSRPIWVSADARLRYLKPGAYGFEWALLEFAERYVQPGDVVLDIGANVGEFSLAAAHRSQRRSHVLAVEPDPFLANLILRTSMEPANQDLGLGVLTSAVSAQTGIEEFFLSARGRASNSLAQCGSEDMGGRRHAYFVSTTAIDAIVTAWRAPNLIKIDVEGAERAVLEGASHTLRVHRPLVYIEIRKDKEQVRKIFLDNGYVLFDPAVKALDTPLTECLFDTLAVPVEGVDGLRAANS